MVRDGEPDAVALARVLHAAFPGHDTSLLDCRRLSAGASRLTLALDALVDGRPKGMVLQLDADLPPPGPPERRGASRTLDTGVQAAVLRVAASSGVPVPAVAWADPAGGVLGAPALLTARVEGETLARRILRDDRFAHARDRFASDCGRILAAVHSAPVDGLGLPQPDVLEAVRDSLDDADEPRPAFELAYAWLGEHRPPPTSPVLVHGDFRNGNLVVAPDGVAAVLDWELAHVGEALEDLGWLCSVAWRFGGDAPVGGMGSREDLYAAYEAAGGAPVDPEAAGWWEVLASLSWGAICMRQARRHLLGQSRSMELAAIGRRVCESEWDLLGLLQPTAPTAPPRSPPDPTDQTDPSDPTGGLHGRPTAAELLDAVCEWLSSDLTPALGQDRSFQLRVASRALATVRREITVGPAQVREHQTCMSAAGYDDDAALARAIRAGDVPGTERMELWPLIRAGVAARLAVANPTYLQRSFQPVEERSAG